MIWQNGEAKDRVLDRVLRSLGVATALFAGGLIYVLKNGARWSPVDDSTYIALRSAYRVVDFFRLQAVVPVATSALRRQLPSGSERLGIEIFILVTALGMAASVFLLMCLFRFIRSFDVIVARSTFGVLLFAAPACYLTVSWMTWSWPQSEPFTPLHGSFFSTNVPLLVFAIEILCVFISRRTTMSKWTVALFVSMHFAFWMCLVWRESRFWFFPIYSRDLILLLIPALPFVYLFLDPSRLPPVHESWRTAWITGVGIGLLLTAFIVVWAPARTTLLSHPREIVAVKIELARGPCFGPCPVDTVTVHGDGRVEYVGRQGHSRFETRKRGRIEPEKVIRILQTLDQVKFMTLEDRAFSWGFDTPSVGVRIWEDGKTKRVVSDAGFVGSKEGRQSRFVQATEAVDGILESTQWSHCEGEECVKPTSAAPTPD